ncbi:MAG: AbrB/MazE/SpoVT family DNA-binding domain-containing protein [Chloroflexota bacterium]
MELIRLRGKGQLTLPDDVRREAHLAEGDYLAVTVRDGQIVLEPKTVVDSAQAWFWSDEWQRGEREAADELRSGQGRRFESPEEFLASLK